MTNPNNYGCFCDISEAQGSIDWAKLKQLNIGVIIRAGQSDFLDSKFVQNYNSALLNGVSFGVYWFFQPNLAPTLQINAFMSMYNSLINKPKVICLDVEDIVYTDANGNKVDVKPPSKEIHSVWIKGWLESIEKQTGVIPFVYTRKNYWDNWVLPSKTVVNGVTLPDWSHFGLWVASWTQYSQNIYMPRDWKEWILWQFEGGTGRQDGIYGPVDLDYYNGSTEEMIEFFGNGSLTDTSGSGVDTSGSSVDSDDSLTLPYTAKVSASWLTVLSKPDVQSSPVKWIPNGTVVTVTKEQDDDFGFIGDGWVSLVYLTDRVSVNTTIPKVYTDTQKLQILWEEYLEEHK